MSSTEAELSQNMFNPADEKTYIDKVLGLENIKAIQKIIKKQELTRTDINEMLYLMTSAESKLVSYTQWDRYIVLKFYIWIRDFVKIMELLYDYEDDLKAGKNLCGNCENLLIEDKKHKDMKICCCDDPYPAIELDTDAKKLLMNSKRHTQHITKFLIDLYLNISRTSLSVNAAGFKEILKNKFEYTYDYGGAIIGQPGAQQPKKGGFFRK